MKDKCKDKRKVEVNERKQGEEEINKMRGKEGKNGWKDAVVERLENARKKDGRKRRERNNKE